MGKREQATVYPFIESERLPCFLRFDYGNRDSTQMIALGFLFKVCFFARRSPRRAIQLF